MLTPDTVLQSRYRIVRQIGQGGMGAVYEAVDLRLGHQVAVKELIISGRLLRQAFEEEARRLAPLRHAALPNVSDHFTDANAGGQYLVMDFIAGNDLGELIRRRGSPFEVEWVVKWAEQLLGALEYLHSRQPAIIHRDIKPSNLKLTPQGDIILLDFGLSKGGTLGSALQMRQLQNSLPGYTPHYAPLEQMRNTGTDERSDIYGLGATLYHLLAAAAPPDAIARADEIVHGKPDPLRPIRAFNPQVPPPIEHVIMQALALNRDLRHQSAPDMRQALQKAILPTARGRGGETTLPDSPTPPLYPAKSGTHSQKRTFLPSQPTNPPTHQSTNSPTLTTCTHCSTQNVPSSLYCQQCEHPLNPKTCTHCGFREMPGRALRCERCGKRG